MCGLNVRLVALLLPIFLCINIYFCCWSDGLSTHCKKQNRKETSCAGCSWKFKIIFFCIFFNFGIEVEIKTLMLVWLIVGNEKLFMMIGLSVYMRGNLIGYKKEEIYLIVIK